MPILIVSDHKKSIQFYQKAFGFELSFPPMEKEGKIMHAEMKLLDSHIMMGPEGTYEGETFNTPKHLGIISPISLYVYVPDVDAHFNHAILNDAQVERPLKTQFYGDRNYTVIDSDGYRWFFAQNVAEFDPTKEPV
jgi:PhnB protein